MRLALIHPRRELELKEKEKVQVRGGALGRSNKSKADTCWAWASQGQLLTEPPSTGLQGECSDLDLVESASQ